MGVGEPLKQVPQLSACVRVHFEDGAIRTVELMTDGKEESCKAVLHDEQGRVHKIILFKDNHVEDTWIYVYDEKTGRRIKKLVALPGEHPSVEMLYDPEGNKIDTRKL